MVSSRVETRTAKLAATDLSATFGQAIPWIGIGVIVGATAYDLKTSCDTMRDMRALEVAFNPEAASDPSVEEVCGLKVPTKEEVWEKIKASPGDAWNSAGAVLDGLPDMTSFEWPSFELPSFPDWLSLP
jgi:hypothetical protein